MKQVRKAVIPAAGLGTRFLPATKAMAKEMLPIIDKPTIQFIVEEALASGIEDILIITGKNKRSIEDHFDSNLELDQHLIENEYDELLQIVRETEGLNLFFVRQSYPNGLGHAVLQAKAFVGNEPFVVMLGDDLMKDEKPLTRQLIDVYEETSSPVIAVMEVPEEDTSKYGIIAPEAKLSDQLHQVKQFVEKPAPEDAPSNLAIIGRYLLTPDIFEILETIEPGAGNEIQLTDAIDVLNQSRQVLAHEFRGDRYDVGNKFGFLQTTIEYGLSHPKVSESLEKFLIYLSHELA